MMGGELDDITRARLRKIKRRIGELILHGTWEEQNAVVERLEEWCSLKYAELALPSDDSDLVREVLRVIGSEPDGVTLTELRDAFSRNRSREVRAAVRGLVEFRRVSVSRDPSSGGRPATRLRVTKDD